MRGQERLTAPGRPSTSGSDDQERQSPHWSLAPFGWQAQQHPRQRASPPGPRRGEAQPQQRKEAAKAQLQQKQAAEEIQPDDGAPLLPGWPRGCCAGGGAKSPARQLGGLCSAAARGCREHAWGVVTAAAVLGVLAWGFSALAGQRQQELDRWMEYVPTQRPAGGAAAAAALPPRPQQQCALPLDGSPWEKHCQRLRHVCFDQGQLILYEDRYQQLDGRRAGELPELKIDTSKLYEYPWRKTSSSPAAAQQAGGAGAQAAAQQVAGAQGAGARRSLLYQVQDPTRTRRLVPLPMRPATSQEPTPYLQAPQFSTCTVPLLMVPSWRGNFFHVFKDLAAIYYSLLRRTPWRRHAKLVVLTPDGLPLTQPEAQLLPTLSQLSVQSLADFSRRLLPGFVPGQELEPGAQPASHEGGEQRCFQDAFFCGRNIAQKQWPAPGEEAALSAAQRDALLAKEAPFEPFSFGQAVVAYQQQAAVAAAQMQRRAWPVAPGGSVQDGISLQEEAAAEAAATGAAPERAAAAGQLRILLQKRGGEGRQISNAPELLAACNAWRYRPPNSTVTVTASCSEVMVPDLASGIAAAREADVLVGIHGANLANGWMMRPGASVIEFTPFQFETVRGSFVFSVTNGWDVSSEVLWWVGVVCDPAVSTPGPTELARQPPEDWWPRDRNSRIPWALLEAALREVVAAGGSRQRYAERYYSKGLHRWHALPGGALHWGGARCPANATAA